MSGESRGSKQCVGRFQFALPKELEVTGRSQSLYDVQLKTVTMPRGGMKALVGAEAERIRALTPPKGVAETLIQTVDLPSNISGIWYFSDPEDADIRGLEAILPAADHAVVATRTSLVGKEGVVEKLVTAVLSSYAPSAARGFCVGDGWMTVDPGRTEEALVAFALVAFDHKEQSGLHLRFETRTVSEPDTRTYSTLDEEAQMARAFGGKMTVLRNHRASAAGLDGKEIWISVVTPNEPPFVRFTWHFPGGGGDSFQPMINIVAYGPAERRQELEAIWAMMMKSLAPVPPAAPK